MSTAATQVAGPNYAAFGLPVATVGLVAAVYFLYGRKPRWPFEKLQRRGTHQSSPIPMSGSALGERKRDFARTAGQNAKKPSLFAVTPTRSSLTPWSHTVQGDGSMSVEFVDSVFDEFERWLEQELGQHEATTGLAARCVSFISATEGFTFAMTNRVPPQFPQSKFVVVLTSTGEVRVAWVAMVNDRPVPNLEETPWIVKLVTGNLNSQAVAEAAESGGVSMQYAVASARDRDLGDYVLKRQAAGFSRAAVENSWDDILSDAV